MSEESNTVRRSLSKIVCSVIVLIFTVASMADGICSFYDAWRKNNMLTLSIPDDQLYAVLATMIVVLLLYVVNKRVSEYQTFVGNQAKKKAAALAEGEEAYAAYLETAKDEKFSPLVVMYSLIGCAFVGIVVFLTAGAFISALEVYGGIISVYFSGVTVFLWTLFLIVVVDGLFIDPKIQGTFDAKYAKVLAVASSLAEAAIAEAAEIAASEEKQTEAKNTLTAFLKNLGASDADIEKVGDALDWVFDKTAAINTLSVVQNAAKTSTTTASTTTEATNQ